MSAIDYWQRSGQRAAQRSASREAVVCVEQALLALQHLPESRDTCEQAIDLRFDLRSALVPLGELGRVLDTLRDAEALAEALGDQQRLGRVSLHLAAHFYFVGTLDQAIAAGQRARNLATASGDVGAQALANFYLGLAYTAQGDYCRARDILRHAVASLHGEHLRERFGFVAPPAVLSRASCSSCPGSLRTWAWRILCPGELLTPSRSWSKPQSMLTRWGAPRAKRLSPPI